MKTFSVVFILITFLFSINLFAQSNAENRLGIGISFNPARIGNVTYNSFRRETLVSKTASNQSPILFYLPINVTDKFRIEPLFGLNSTHGETSSTSTDTMNTNSSMYTNLNDDATITIGVSGFYRTSLSNFFALYFGPRISYTFISIVSKSIYGANFQGNNSTTIYKTETTETDLTVGLAFGMEYFPISQISFGGEVSFNYTSFGNPDEKYTITPPQPSNTISTTKRNRHSSRTDGLFFVRWYFL